MANENCLKDIKCPKCGHEEQFRIAVEKVVLVTDDGTEDLPGDTEWGENSFIECTNCEATGTVGEFTQPLRIEPGLAVERATLTTFVVQVTVPIIDTLRYNVKAKSEHAAIEQARELFDKEAEPDVEFGENADRDAAKFEVIEEIEEGEESAEIE